ncbi:MAG: type II toxin-antitoxin system HicB family antitoxin [Dehalococcoidia bacterium]|nr:type II toxin-antitoxin system HicB family antitoxin [Dehalococcoidia bacterium]
MSREFTVIVREGEDGYLIGTVPELRGCHTQARTVDELLERAREVILLCLEDDDEQAGEAGHFVGLHRIAV